MATLRDAKIEAYCQALGCGHEASITVDSLPDEFPVPDVGLQLRCTKCGSPVINTRPN